MKKTLVRKREKAEQEESEYRFDYSESKPNRFAGRMMNAAPLRSVIFSVPQSKRKRTH
jgi:hypothetical protein